MIGNSVIVNALSPPFFFFFATEEQEKRGKKILILERKGMEQGAGNPFNAGVTMREFDA